LVAVIAVVPLKAVASAKGRMAPALTPEERALLLHRTFERVVAAARAAAAVAEVLAVVGDAVGRGWAQDLDVRCVDEPPGAGLNAAVAAVDALLGARATLVVPADLPLVRGEDLDAVVAALPAPRGVVVAPTADGGTGALLRVPGGVVPPCFGPRSADAHLAAAMRRRVRSVRLRVPGLALDLDRPSDLAAAGGWSAVTAPTTLAP
jgi:2-phospho-L-lactate/phosphoenolpyruvate guanylyltransferase